MPPHECVKYPVTNLYPQNVFSPLLGLTLGVGIISTACLDAHFSIALAQFPTVTQTNQSEKTSSQMTVLFVNPLRGDDQVGDGSEISPWKTLTQALQIAPPNSVIMLAPGTYSVQNGEKFPLMLKPGVAIQGNNSNKGRDIKIVGGGEFLSRSFGGQNVAIVGANQASLTGVTVTNTNPRGYGVWIESSNTVIRENTFTGSTQDGVAVTGNAIPSIHKNYFYRNGANGITISGNSRPEVRENLFQQTGFGVNIAQNAAPVLVANQIQNNRAGILVQANARPILRNNVIQGSKEDGLVVIAQALPDLGSPSDPGRNVFNGNGRYDINAKTAKQAIAVPGNNLNRNRIAGRVDFSGTTAPVARNLPPSSLRSNSAVNISPRNNSLSSNSPRANSLQMPEVAVGGEIVFSAPTAPKTGRQPTRLVNNRISNPRQLPPVPTNTQIIPARTRLQPIAAAEPQQTPQLNYVNIEPGVIEFTAPQVSATRNNPTRNLQPISTLRPHSNDRPGVRYRVLVLVENNQQRDLLRSLNPGAFSTVWQGRQVMQAGVFSNQYNADEISRQLNSQGLKAIIEQLN
jgi:parallel beta-helix repeat protein